ncbi:unnamed protein product [Meloidogyne enterolobii]|uniref:Uncharacterized protein n=1 Tax=Meloidogyne enterolobii TaxID=390850 RepID=A0ACB0Z3G6_MELEN
MLEFIRLLDAVCPTFRNSLENQQQQKHKIEMTTKMANSASDKNVGGEGGGGNMLLIFKIFSENGHFIPQCCEHSFLFFLRFEIFWASYFYVLKISLKKFFQILLNQFFLSIHD